MMTNAKKFVVLVLLIFMLVTSISNVFAYEVTVTKDNLQAAFNEYAKGYEGGYVTQSGTPGVVIFGESTPIEVREKQLVQTVDDTTYYIDHSLDGNPTFTIKTTFNKDSKVGDVMNFDELLLSPVVGILGVSLVQEMPMGEAYHYFGEVEDACSPFKDTGNRGMASFNDTLTITIGEEQKEFKQDSFKPSEIVNLLFDEEKVVNDEQNGIYTYTVTAKAASEENYELKAVLEIKKDADFSKIAPLGEDDSNTNTNTNTNTNKSNASKNNTNTNKSKNTTLVNKTNTTNQSSLPETGSEETVFVVIGLIIIVAFVFIIKLNQYKDVK